MKKTTIVALLLLSFQGFAENLNDSLQKIESEWASIYYDTPKQQQGSAYGRLLDKTINLARQFPGNAEPFIWEAIVKATNADHQNPVSALEAVHENSYDNMIASHPSPSLRRGLIFRTLDI